MIEVLNVNKQSFTKREEVYHAITHGLGTVLSLIGLILLIIHSAINGNALKVVSVTIFGTTMLLMYVMSTIVHSLPKGRAKNVFQIFDHSSIYLFIAGTYTPFLLVHLHGKIGMILLIIIWAIAIIGVTFKVFFTQRFVFLSTVFYIVMGWLIVLVWKPLTAAMATNGIVLLVSGGLAYTIGAIFFLWRSLPYHHVIWHLFVIAGSALHFFAIFYYVI